VAGAPPATRLPVPGAHSARDGSEWRRDSRDTNDDTERSWSHAAGGLHGLGMADAVGAGGLTRDTLSEFGLPDAARAEATALRRNAVRLAHLLSRQQLEAGRAPGRLVTIRISGFHMDGTLPSRTVILRLATLSSLRLPEVLVWSGGVRLVYTEYVVATAGSPRPVDASPRLTAVNGEREGYVDDAELTSPLAAELRAHHDRAVGFFLALLEQRFGAIHYTLQRQHARNQVPLALASPPTQRSPRSPKGWDASTRVAAAPAPAAAKGR